MWNYDIAFSWDRNNRGAPISYEPRLSGRKFYWQHKRLRWDRIIAQNQTDDNGKLISRSNLNNTIRPIKPCSRETGNGNPEYSFKFEVYFERVSEDELEKLIAVLHLGGTGYHSIGHGKPFGLGSSKIEVDGVKVRKLTLENEKVVRNFDDYEGWKDCRAKSLTEVFGADYHVKQMAALCSVHDFGQVTIDYPRPENEVESCKWFVYNRGKSNKLIIKQVLPELPDNADSLDDRSLAEKVSLERNRRY